MRPMEKVSIHLWVTTARPMEKVSIHLWVTSQVESNKSRPGIPSACCEGLQDYTVPSEENRSSNLLHLIGSSLEFITSSSEEDP